MILVIDRKNTLLRYRAGSLLVEQPGKDTRRLPLNQLEQVVVYGNPMAETAVWRALGGRNIPTTLLAGRGKASAAMLGSGLATQLPLRRMQHQYVDNQRLRIAIAHWFLDSKLQSYALPLTVLRERFTEKQEDIHTFIIQQDKSRLRLKQAKDIDTLMGVEGAIARAWFALLARLTPIKWRFTGRNRQPPRDPVNALLSLGYTMLHSELRQVILSSGFDPSLGFLHKEYPGREALVLDFTELFRSGVDYFVLNLISMPGLTEDSFYYRDSEGCRLSKAARPLFYKAWAQFREDWPRSLTDSHQSEEWTVAPLRNQARGQIAMLRKFMLAQGQNGSHLANHKKNRKDD